ncbi:MAG: transcription termination factor NusA [Tissierellia bacterium]|nr:transcription termination factor NusA [Tissierellia bacterium]
MNEEFIGALNEIEQEKGIPKELVFEALESALISSYKKNYGTSQNVIINMNRENGDISIYASKEIVEEVEDPLLEISLDDAKKINPIYEIGDVYNMEIHPKNFGRIAAQTAKQVVIQRIKDAERDVIFEDFTDREREIITGLVQRNSHGNVYVDLGKTEAILPVNEQIKNESYEHGDRYKFLLLEVKRSPKGPQIILSRSHPDLIKRLFELEVPEINEGIVEIYSIARESGSRTKIAVFSRDEEVDPLGACVGYKGARVNAIVDELQNEKIDIVIWEKEIEKFIANALSPSKVEKVFVNEREKSALVVVPDYQLSLAIGKEGQNVRLAAKLTNWKIDIKSVTQFEEYLNLEDMTEEELREAFKSQGKENSSDFKTVDEADGEEKAENSSVDCEALETSSLTETEENLMDSITTDETVGMDHQESTDFSKDPRVEE